MSHLCPSGVLCAYKDGHKNSHRSVADYQRRQEKKQIQYATDPEFAERKRQRERERARTKRATDPEWCKRKNERDYESWKAKFLTDPEFAEHERARWRKYSDERPSAPLRASRFRQWQARTRKSIARTDAIITKRGDNFLNIDAIIKDAIAKFADQPERSNDAR